MPRNIQNPGGDDQYTPPWIFEALNIQFDLDVCAPEGGIPWIPATNHYSIKDDALTQPWYGNVWMNPPYSKIDPWARRLVEHGNGITLVPFSRSRWSALVWETAHAIMDTPTEIKFVTMNGIYKPIFMPVYLIAYGEQNVQAMKDSGIGRVRC